MAVFVLDRAVQPLAREFETSVSRHPAPLAHGGTYAECCARLRATLPECWQMIGIGMPPGADIYGR